jgi:hypothetical protein
MKEHCRDDHFRDDLANHKPKILGLSKKFNITTLNVQCDQKENKSEQALQIIGQS